jgi:hypothetical protein
MECWERVLLSTGSFQEPCSATQRHTDPDWKLPKVAKKGQWHWCWGWWDKEWTKNENRMNKKETEKGQKMNKEQKKNNQRNGAGGMRLRCCHCWMALFQLQEFSWKRDAQILVYLGWDWAKRSGWHVGVQKVTEVPAPAVAVSRIFFQAFYWQSFTLFYIVLHVSVCDRQNCVNIILWALSCILKFSHLQKRVGTKKTTQIDRKSWG